MGTIQFKEVNCKNCYKCIRNCPVKAISLIDDHAQVIEDGCVLCGKCLHICPQNAKSVKNEVNKVKAFIEKKQKVYASIAPSFPAAFHVMDYQRISSVFEKLGFVYVEETAVGASVVTEEYKKLLEKKEMKNIISTACPTVVSLVEKHYPQLLDQLAPVVSPMVAHGKMLKELYGPRIKVVFIGPCLSKKEEYRDSQNDKIIDAVITFDEMEEWIKEAGLCFEDEVAEGIDRDDSIGGANCDIGEVEKHNICELHMDSKFIADKNDENLSKTTLMERNNSQCGNGSTTEILQSLYNQNSRFYPAPGGIIKSIGGFKKYKYKPLKFDGTERCIEVLESIRSGRIKGYFIEMNSCAGSCLEGPCMNENKLSYIETREKLLSYIGKCNRDNAAVNEKRHQTTMHIDEKQDFSKIFFDKSNISEIPEEKEIQEILATIGKFTKEDELNCGACGYTSCREKATAVIHGKAESHMCLPYMRQRAESISNVIIHSTPNAIFALSEQLDIQEANLAACRMFQLENEEYKDKKIYEILECPDIYQVLETKTDLMNTKFYYENYNLIVEQSILYIKENRTVIVIMKDITGDEKKQLKMNKVKADTVEIAQKVIEKQMRVAQEIASLLGETTAETKVALTKLKNAIQSEMGDEQ